MYGMTRCPTRQIESARSAANDPSLTAQMSTRRLSAAGSDSSIAPTQKPAATTPPPVDPCARLLPPPNGHRQLQLLRPSAHSKHPNPESADRARTRLRRRLHRPRYANTLLGQPRSPHRGFEPNPSYVYRATARVVAPSAGSDPTPNRTGRIEF